MAAKKDKPLFDISAYQEQKKRVDQNLTDLLTTRDYYTEKYEKSRKACIGYFILMIACLTALGVMQSLIPKVGTGAVYALTVLKLGFIVAVLWSSYILITKAPDCVAIKYDDTWYRYRALYEYLNKKIEDTKHRQKEIEETLEKADKYIAQKPEDAVLPTPQALEDGSFYGRQASMIEENEEGDLVISLEEALSSLEEEDA